MKIFLRLLFYPLFFALLTLLTQVGGIALIVYGITRHFIARRFPKRSRRLLVKAVWFMTIYILFCWVIVPPIAKHYGRVPLPKMGKVYPQTLFYSLLYRNYVRPEMYNYLMDAADHLQAKYPDAKIAYFDTSFPFKDGYPLKPHRKHEYGKAVDVAYFYKDRKTGKPTNKKLTYSGYGSFTEPQKGETNMPAQCEERGYWQYELTQYTGFSPLRTDLVLDEERSRYLLEYFAKGRRTRRIFVEPHIEERLNLTKYKKLRFHGCQAVRHDDHFHLEID